MISFADLFGVLVPMAVAMGAVGYFGKTRSGRLPQKHFEAEKHLAELEARLKAASSSKFAKVEPVRRPIYALTSVVLARIGARVQRVDPNYADGAPDFLWLLFAAGEDNIGVRLAVRLVEEDNGLWLVSLENTYKFQRPVTKWSVTGSMDEVVEAVLSMLASWK